MNPWIRAGWPLKRVETRWMTPGVSILVDCQFCCDVYCNVVSACDARLAFEILHNVEEPVIDFRLFDEADLDLVQIAERILFIRRH